VATLTELYEPLGINDNLTIPVLASLALQIGFARIRNCSNTPFSQLMFDTVVDLKTSAFDLKTLAAYHLDLLT